MKPNHKRSIAVVAAGLLALAGAGGTYAATKSSGDTERKAFLDDVAKRLKVDPKDLTTALREAYFARLDAAVKAGKLSKEEADAIKKRIGSSGDVPFGPFGGPGPGGGPPGGGPPGFFHRGGPHGPGGGGPLFGGIDAAAKFLGLTRAELGEQLRSGKSLADVAKDKGKSVDDLKSAIKAEVKSKLDDAVDKKRLTQDQADAILKDVDAHLDDFVNGKPGNGLRGKRGNFRGFHGPPPSGSAPGNFDGVAPQAGGGQI